MEKPFTQTAEQAEELMRIASNAKRVLSVFQNRRWDGDFLTVQRVVNENMLGQLVEYEARWDRFRNFIRPNTWKEEARSGAGMLYDLGSHLIDQVLVLFGLPKEVTAHLKTMRTDGEIVDWFDVRLHYAGINAAVRGSYLAREPSPRYVLHGTLGTFIKHGIDPQEAALQQGRVPTEADWGEEPEQSWGTLSTEKDDRAFKGKIETKRGNYSAFYDNIYACLFHGGELAVKPREALNVIKVIEAAKVSHQIGKTVDIR